jgi:transcriptional regulator GlxA family with amidase domain
MTAAMGEHLPKKAIPRLSRSGAAAAPIRVTFLLAPQFPMLAFAAAIDPLRVTNRLSGKPLFEWRLASVDGGPVEASNGIPIAVHDALDRLRDVDLVIVCVGLEPLQFGRQHKIHHQLRRLAHHGATIGAVSCGTFVLAEAGLLAGRRATVHWEYDELFRKRYPTLELSRELFVVDRDVFTCCGGTAALDMMLHFVRQAFGGPLAQAVAEQFIYPRIRDEEEDQRAAIQTRYAVASPRLAQVIATMEATLDEPLSLRDIAQQAGISTRQIERLFKEQMGMGPSMFYLQRRLERARTLLRQTLQPIREVAMECGFGSTAHFSHAYKKAFGFPPTRERSNTRSRC